MSSWPYAAGVTDLAPAIYRLLAAVVLLLMFGLALSSMAQKAPTFDEQGFIVRGLATLRGHTQIRVGHPLGLNAPKRRLAGWRRERRAAGRRSLLERHQLSPAC